MDEDTTIGCFLAALSILFAPLSWLLHGWVLSLLWRWFIVSHFEVGPISIPIAIGISVIAGFLTSHANINPQDDKDDRNVRMITSLMMNILTPLSALFIGWIVYQIGVA